MINFICALKCEASPIISHYELRHKRESRLFNIYTNREQNVSLTITGMGKFAANAGTIYAHSLLSTQPGDVWINLGIAGHAHHSIGDIFWANRIQDAGSGEIWYPQMMARVDIPGEHLLCLDQPSIGYDEQMFDMESSGFLSAACRIGTSELIHCIKVISDNFHQPAVKIDAKKITGIITNTKDNILKLALQLDNISKELTSNICIDDEYNEFLLLWHFTGYQQNKLKKLLHRWHLLFQGSGALLSIKDSSRDANTVLIDLQKIMDDSDFFLKDSVSHV